MHYEQLKAGVIQHDLLIDNLIYKVGSYMLTLFVFTKSLLFNFVVLGYWIEFRCFATALKVKHFVHQDVKLTASNDDYYFVFEDFLYQVIFHRSVMISHTWTFPKHHYHIHANSDYCHIRTVIVQSDYYPSLSIANNNTTCCSVVALALCASADKDTSCMSLAAGLFSR